MTSKSSSTRRTLADLRANEYKWSPLGSGYTPPAPIFLDEIPARHLKQGDFGILTPDWTTWHQGSRGEELVTCTCQCGDVHIYHTGNLYAGVSQCADCLRSKS